MKVIRYDTMSGCESTVASSGRMLGGSCHLRSCQEIRSIELGSVDWLTLREHMWKALVLTLFAPDNLTRTLLSANAWCARAIMEVLKRSTPEKVQGKASFKDCTRNSAELRSLENSLHRDRATQCSVARTFVLSSLYARELATITKHHSTSHQQRKPESKQNLTKHFYAFSESWFCSNMAAGNWIRLPSRQSMETLL